jgi:hypothetical protein
LLPGDESEPLGSLLILAPTGVYTGRVKHGIEMVIGQYADKSETKIRVLLVAGTDWIKLDQTYKAKFVDKLKDEIMATCKDEKEYNIQCDDIELSFEREEYVSGWMLKELCAFFTGDENNPKMGFIDTTGGPKEWWIAALHAVHFFSPVEVYTVRPYKQKKPSDYDQSEVDDPGFSKLEMNPPAEAILNDWVRPEKIGGKEGEINDEYYLFKTIYVLARRKAGASADALTKAWVDIEQDAEYREYVRILPKDKAKKFHNESAGKKSISVYLTTVAPYGLLEVKEKAKKKKSVRLTPMGAMLAVELFRKTDGTEVTT